MQINRNYVVNMKSFNGDTVTLVLQIYWGVTSNIFLQKYDLLIFVLPMHYLLAFVRCNRVYFVS